MAEQLDKEDIISEKKSDGTEKKRLSYTTYEVCTRDAFLTDRQSRTSSNQSQRHMNLPYFI